MNLRLRLPAALVALVAASLAAPAAASASHIQGGSINSKITSDGHLTGTVTFLTANPCTLGDPAWEMPSITARNPADVSRSIPITGTSTRCLPGSSTATGTYDVDIATLWGSAPDGAYTVTAAASARVSGILNSSTSLAQFDTRVTKTGFANSSSPVLNSGVANTVPKGHAYKQNLNGVDPDGGGVTFTSRAGTSGGPSYDIVHLSSAGMVSMSSAETALYNDGDHFSYTARATDAQGDFSERDVLLVVSGNNAPPSIHGLPTSPVAATSGAGPRTVSFTADDPDGAQTVGLTLAAGAPSWVSLTASGGNPANATLTVDPPASVPAGTYAFNVDGVDSDMAAPLFASEAVEVTVANPVPETTLGSKPSAFTRSTSASFAFASDEAGVSYECRLDGGAWSTCTSPQSVTGLADGAHTFQVRATDAAGQTAAPESHTWTVDTAAPAAPAVTGAPAGSIDAENAQLAWTGEPAGSFECSLDGGPFAACVSPLGLAGQAPGPHTFAVRQIDAAGNAGAVRTIEWTVAAAVAEPPAPGAPTPPAADPARVKLAVITGPSAAVTVQGDTASVGCRATGGALSACTVGVYARDRAGERGVTVTASAARKRGLVLIGRGRVRAAGDGAGRLAVEVELNRTGRRLLAARIAGVRAILRIKARTVGGTTLGARKAAKLVPQTQLIVPQGSLFASASPRLSKAGAALIGQVGRRLGKVAAVTCTGHTDSINSAAVNRALGLARAKAVCAALKRHGVRGKVGVRSAGEARPRATNRTVAGRALNRRVEIAVRYR